MDVRGLNTVPFIGRRRLFVNIRPILRAKAMPGNTFLTWVCIYTALKSISLTTFTAKAILDSNVPTPLKGIAIGNGWIDAMAQYPAYVEYAAKYGIIKEGSEVLSLVIMFIV